MNELFLWIASWNDNFFQKTQFLYSLPIHLQNEILKYKFESDQNQSLVSKILIKKMLKKWGYDFEDLHYCPNQKPYLHHPNSPPYFSYSKSKEKVALAWSWDIEVGVDIEYLYRQPEWKIFQSRLSPSVWSKIIHEENPSLTFLKCWTHIEAILKLKAVGLANHIGLVNYSENENEWFFKDEKIYIQNLEHHKHFITLACYKPFQLNMKEITL